jgi:hypothetical protein
MNCNFNTKKEGNVIYIKKVTENVLHEKMIYEILGKTNYTSTFIGIEECSDKRYSIIKCEWLIHYDNYIDSFTYTNEKIKALIRNYFTNVLNCYMFLISKNVIHGDLKPENILLNDNTKQFILTDFDKSLHVKNGDLYAKIFTINKDFLRFFRLFISKFFILNKRKLDINESYQNFNKQLLQISSDLNITESELNVKFSNINEYFNHINNIFTRLIRSVSLLNGGKKLNNIPKKNRIKNTITINPNNKYGTSNTPHNKNKTESKLQLYSTTGRNKRRCLYRKRRNTRSRKV